ncbi:hypothetical protein Hdeb2414_s0057g00758531 [Helianthus debilis subsp. tardiflorus]
MGKVTSVLDMVLAFILRKRLQESLWVARRPPGCASVDFDDRRDLLDVIRASKGRRVWRRHRGHLTSHSAWRAPSPTLPSSRRGRHGGLAKMVTKTEGIIHEGLVKCDYYSFI